MNARAYRFLALVLWRAGRWYVRRRLRPARRWATFSRWLFSGIATVVVAVLARRAAS